MYQNFIKRILDVVLCSFALIVLLPVFLIAAVGIKVSSPGPVFYYSDRAGKYKKSFHFYKFRSMHIPKDGDKGLFVADEDRLFRFGKLIRRLKIDELPQLINVIQGKMSIVGPRPMPHSSVDAIYSGKYEKITQIRPGLTSAASLFDYMVGDTYTDNTRYIKEVLPIKLEMELMYAERQSFAYDVQLVFRTMKTIILVFAGKKDFRDMPEYTEIQEKQKEKAETV